MVASDPGVIRLREVEHSVETRDNQRYGPVSRLSFSDVEGVSQLNTCLPPKTGQLQRRINETKSLLRRVAPGDQLHSWGFLLCGGAAGSC